MVLPVTASDSSQVGHARRQAVAMASVMGFSELRQGQLGIIITEAAGNIAAHAQQGEIVLTPWQFRGDSGIDVLALDSGKGIADIGRSLEDGFSTAGTPGQGLGAMRLVFLRHSGAHSSPGNGTVLFARIVQESEPAEVIAKDYDLGAVSLPITGEMACGDALGCRLYPWSKHLSMVADGLGHGPLAAEAAAEAIRNFKESAHLSPARILADAH